MRAVLFCVVIPIFTMTVSLQSYAETLSDGTLSGQSESRKVNQHLDDLQQVINAEQSDDDLLREMETRLKDLHRQVAKRLEAKIEKKVPAAADSEPKDLGKWWLRGAMTYDPMPSGILNRLELSYTYKRKTGNLTMDNSMLKAALATRYKRFTSYLNYTFDKRNVGKPNDDYDPATNQWVEQNSDIRDSTRHLLTEELRFALSKRFYTAAGFMYEEDDYVKLDRRLTGYLGVGGKALQTDRITLKLFAAVGHEEKDYTEQYHELAGGISEAILRIVAPSYDPDTVKSDMVYLAQNFDWHITKNLSLREKLTCFMDLEESDDYRWTLDLGLALQLTKYMSLTFDYKESMDNTRDPVMGRKRDISMGPGVRIHF